MEQVVNTGEALTTVTSPELGSAQVATPSDDVQELLVELKTYVD